MIRLLALIKLAALQLRDAVYFLRDIFRPITKPEKKMPSPSARWGASGWLADKMHEAVEPEVVQESAGAYKTMIEQVKAGDAIISESNVLLFRKDEYGNRLPATKITESTGKEFTKPEYISVPLKNEEAQRLYVESPNVTYKPVKESATKKLREDYFDTDMTVPQTYDAQFTEYTPIMHGPYYTQMYMYDMLAAHSRCYFEYNHNAVARRIIDLLLDYSMGRGYKVNSKDAKALARWNAFDKKYRVHKMLKNHWGLDKLLYGELFIDRITIKAIHPSTIWDIITEPEDITNVYYYYQSFPTQYQQFTGFDVPGVPGSKKQPGMKYIIRQIPYDRVAHFKSRCSSAEKRGRPTLYPILEWLKRFRDYNSARMVREWSQACWTYDVTVKGSSSDVQTESDKASTLPYPGSSYIHNEAVTRELLAPPVGSAGDADFSNALVCVLAFIIGAPKEFFNVQSTGGSRATALVASEPFAKVIDNIQGEFEEILHELAVIAWEMEGDEYDDELEFVFPSITKDTTTETLTNIQSAEAAGYIDHQTAAVMAAAELGITTYEYNEVQQKIADDREMGLQNTADILPPSSRFSTQLPDKSPIHGDGKEELKDELGNI